MYRLIPLLLVFCACTSPGSRSGFLPDYSLLAPGEEGASTFVSETFADYDRFLIDPFVAYFHPNVQGRPVDPNELDFLLTNLRGALIDNLDDDYLLAREPGPGVLRIEVAVTGLYSQTEDRAGIGLGGASVEMRGTDSETGALQIAAMGSRGMRELDASGAGGWKWGVTEALAHRWAVWLKAQVDAASGE